MTTELQYQDNPAGVTMVFYGDVTGKELIDANNRIADCKECTYQLTDFTGMKKLDISMEELHRVAIQDCTVPPDSKLKKLAIVGDTKRYARLIDLYYLFVNVWVGKSRNYETRTFNDLEDARKWLGI